MKIAPRYAIKWGVLAMTACMSPLLLQAQAPPACPTTVNSETVFGSVSICAETDNYWFEFTDLSTLNSENDTSYTALPEDTYFHIDTITPGTIAITIEPGGDAQFQAGDTYAWEFDVVEDAATNIPFYGVSAAYDADLGMPQLVTTVNALDITYPVDTSDPGSSVTVGSQLVQLTLNNGALQMAGVGGVDGLQFVDVLSGIGASVSIQSISNDVEETPEPQTVVLLGIGLFLILISRRSLAPARRIR